MASDRSTLEGKDRAELTVIAQAMGNKVGSRMRKAQIIDLIVGPEPDETAAKKQAETQLDFSSSVSTDGSADDQATGDAARGDDADTANDDTAKGADTATDTDDVDSNEDGIIDIEQFLEALHANAEPPTLTSVNGTSLKLDL